MTKNIEIKTDNLDKTAPLYRQYDGQTNPQPAHVEIDPRGDVILVSADYSHEIGNAIPAYAYHNLVEQIPCPNGLLGESLIEYLGSDGFKDQVLEMCEGYEEHWNGSNHVGRWNQWAQQISEAIESDLRDLEYVELHEGCDWIEDDVYFFNAAGESCDEDDAVRAVYGDSAESGIEINRENLITLVEDAESYADHETMVIGLEGAFEDIIERLEENQA